MMNLLLRADKGLLLGCALGVAALTGWSSFAYSSLSSRSEAKVLRAERDAALGRHQQLQQSAGDLAQVEAKLAAARNDYTRTVQGWAEARTRLGTAQQELAVLSKRIEASKERVTQTGSIKASPEPPKTPAAKKPEAAASATASR